MQNRYTDERNVQILVSLLKQHGIKRVIASPGTTNITFVECLQGDPFFEVFSSVDERSAAYMACGMAAETGEPVVLSCTGATASRNYLPGLTEAFYRKLPVLAVTSTQHPGRIGRNVPQVMDRRSPLNDVCVYSFQSRSIASADDRLECELCTNEALLELTRHGGGPVHIDLVTTYSDGFSADGLPVARKIDRIFPGDDLPPLEGKRVEVFVGAHRPWSEKLVAAVDSFCATYGAAVLCDQTSNYRGAYRVLAGLVSKQECGQIACNHADVIVYIGDISGAYLNLPACEVWRVNPDGRIREPFGTLRYVFEMNEQEFFESYAAKADSMATFNVSDEWDAADASLRDRMPELPFSNIWCAEQMASELPENAVLHLGILNTLRSWNFFETPNSVSCFCNTGGFGIDGCVSTLIGASLVSPEKLFFGVVGDLACFYDLNSMGNRHVGSNLRIMLVNNGVGTEFKNYSHKAAQFGEDADSFMAARGHFGAQSPDLMHHYAEDLGFEYLSASNKEEFSSVVGRFTDSEMHDRPLLLEVFTDSQAESDALKAVSQIEVDAKHAAKAAIKGALGDKGVSAVKKLLGR